MAVYNKIGDASDGTSWDYSAMDRYATAAGSGPAVPLPSLFPQGDPHDPGVNDVSAYFNVNDKSAAQRAAERATAHARAVSARQNTMVQNQAASMPGSFWSTPELAAKVAAAAATPTYAPTPVGGGISVQADDWMIVAGGVAAFLLIGGAGYMVLKNRKKR